METFTPLSSFMVPPSIPYDRYKTKSKTYDQCTCTSQVFLHTSTCEYYTREKHISTLTFPTFVFSDPSPVPLVRTLTVVVPHPSSHSLLDYLVSSLNPTRVVTSTNPVSD